MHGVRCILPGGHAFLGVHGECKQHLDLQAADTALLDIERELQVLEGFHLEPDILQDQPCAPAWAAHGRLAGQLCMLQSSAASLCWLKASKQIFCRRSASTGPGSVAPPPHRLTRSCSLLMSKKWPTNRVMISPSQFSNMLSLTSYLPNQGPVAGPISFVQEQASPSGLRSWLLDEQNTYLLPSWRHSIISLVLWCITSWTWPCMERIALQLQVKLKPGPSLSWTQQAVMLHSYSYRQAFTPVPV